MQGLGNDFVVIDGVNQRLALTPSVIRYLSDRHLGVGCDQVLIVEKPHSSDTDFFYRIFNSDGSEVGQCGNGARCLAKFIHEMQLSHKSELVVETITGKLTLCLQQNGTIKVSMGAPHQIRTVAINDNNFTCLSIGNPHAVLQVTEVTTAPVELLGQHLNHHLAFPEGVNVGFMQIISPEKILLRVYERGAGETQACGSGACAAVVAGQIVGKLKNSVTVELLGGELQIGWTGNDQPIWMTGPAETVFDGKIKLNNQNMNL